MAQSTLTVSLAGSRDRQLDELLQSCGARVTPLRIEDLAALAQATAVQPSLVVLDMRDKTALPPAVAILRRQHASTGVMIVASTQEPTLMLEAMRAGVTEFLTIPLTVGDLRAAIERVTAKTAHLTDGQVFAFIGAKGGVGTTTVAVNVATALAKVGPGPTLMIDLHLAYGDAAVFLGIEPRFSILDAVENVHRLDKTFLSGLAAPASAGLALLASSDRASVMPVDVDTIRSLIESAARHYSHVVLDIPRSDVMLDALEPASQIVIVANQELATVRAATRLSAALRQRYGKGRVSVVVSRYDQLSDIGREDIEKVLGSPVADTFPSNYRVAIEALNNGRPVVLDNHNKLAASLTGYARRLAKSDEPTTTEPSARQTGFLGRLTGRRT